jgi:hypothetical protein
MLNRLQPDQICDDLPIAKHGQFQIVSLREIGQLFSPGDSGPFVIENEE